MDEFQDPFFRGCTRPAMLVGVPLMPMVLTTAGFMLLGVWMGYLLSGYLSLALALLYVPVVLAMRAATKLDDQRLHQLWLRLRMRLFAGASRRRWGAYSYCPLQPQLET